MSSQRTSVRSVIVLGAGPTGLTTAMLLARTGCRVVVVDRDSAGPPDGERAWTEWSRPGVSQFRQVHVALPRWYRVLHEELPEVETALLERGGARVNLVHLQPESLTGGWWSGDEQYATVTARRPVIEAALASVAASEPHVTVLRGRRAVGLLTTERTGALRDHAAGSVRVVGVRTDDGPIEADLVVDAAGHRTPVPRWLTCYGSAPREERSADGLVYYTRHYRGVDGPPIGAGGALTHHASYSVLTLPADNRTWGVAIIVAASDRATRRLREARCWEAALRSSGMDERWLAGTPLGEVQPLAGLVDISRAYASGSAPVVSGLVAVGDAWATTSPFLGRGLSLGALQAAALRDAVAGYGSSGVDRVATHFTRLLDDRVLPLVHATIGFGRHRVAEMAAEAAGVPYRTDDPSWAASTALAAGAREDPVLLRAHGKIACLLATPAEVFADPETRARVGRWFGTTHHPPSGRTALLDAIADIPSLEGALS